MTTLELRQAVLRDLAPILDNDEAMKKLQKFLYRLKGDKAEKEMSEKEKEEILDDIREGLLEVKAARTGKIKLQSAREFLDEIRS